MQKIEVTVQEARAIIKLNEIHRRNLFRNDYEDQMNDPISEALDAIGWERTDENQERILNLASMYFDVLKII